jgi:hypothetical protein
MAAEPDTGPQGLPGDVPPGPAGANGPPGPLAGGRSSVDALRSLQKYVARVLGPEWEVRLAWEEGLYRRPFCRVGWAGPEVTIGPAHHVDVTRPFNLLCHPAEKGTSREATLEAGRVADLLAVGIRLRGTAWDEPGDPGDPSSAPVRAVGRPNRIPLWDWTGVPFNATVAQRFDRDYLRVADFSVSVIDDPADELRRAVACDLRLRWRRRGEVASGPVLERVAIQLDSP